MKLKTSFALRQVADTWIVLPVGAASVDFNSILTLNETGALLWQALERGADREKLVDALMREYIVDRSQSLVDVDEFLKILKEVGCVQ